METNATTDLQKEIKRLLSIIGWSQKRLGAEIYLAKYDDDNELDIRKTEESVKRSLSRNSTKLEVLEHYLKFITSHQDYLKTNYSTPLYISTNILPYEIEEEMKKISTSINKKLSQGT
ncbi:MAG: hypothetical protein B7Y56_08820 [Gallionellales bacterium 35-53-114]|jgi:hypothetical protein|nr:MAG: hypothetical protein B7Y56_08820 [Gallionellales bacterium 35-53-114]OYZ62726.1 MAG: hypothetical protein B7Y04_12675 [Gallionellales bacterium 24-53-125]OZB09802.1 MAG: hypothetical protein B7X61_04575 [Gallionellales bacterium 39-52-133]HQS57634.1 hypothetical protein [Gallionellaceae bacterium]HQS74088.1 hypothetical protein [Gallionellaceae bacterium]